MQEWTQQQLLDHTKDGNGPSFGVFLYTPFCGTCQLTERMLGIILTMLPELPLYKSNINFLPQLVRDWRIKSVPCIVMKERDKEMEFLYSMKSVDELYLKLLPLSRPNNEINGGHE